MKRKNCESSSAILAALIFLLHAATSTYAQDNWVTIGSDDGTISFSIPSSYLVHREAERITIFATSPEAEFSFSLRETESARKQVKAYPGKMNGSTSGDKEEGKEFVIRRYEFQRPASYSGSIYHGQGNKLVTFSFSSDRPTDPSIIRFRSSLVLLGSTQYQGTASDAVGPKIKLSSLTTSKEIVEALKMPDAPGTAVSLAFVSDEEPVFEKRFSRRLIVIAKPQASYTDSARMAQKAGTIRARVEFLSSGHIGAIVVDPRLDRSLAANVANAARRIKFVPAQVNGRSVDVVKVFKYSFSIY